MTATHANVVRPAIEQAIEAIETHYETHHESFSSCGCCLSLKIAGEKLRAALDYVPPSEP